MNRNHLLVLFLSFITVCTGVRAQTTVYARTTGNWSSTNTWSTVGPSGATCGCIPGVLDSVVVNGRTVTVDMNADARSVYVLGASTLTFNNSMGLDINAGHLQVDAGGSVTHGGTGSAAHIDFETGNNVLTIASGATCNTEDVEVAANATLVMKGAGDFTLTDDFAYMGTGSLVTNNLTGNFNLTGAGVSSLWFQTSGGSSKFINNGTVNVDRWIFVQAANDTVINNGTINLTNASFGISMNTSANGTYIRNNGTMNCQGNIVATNLTVRFDNAGTLDLEGSLTSWSNTAPSEFHNLTGATFNMAGTGQFYGNFYGDYSGNTVTFDNTLALQNELIDPVDNYWHLNYTGFQKQMKSTVNCKGNFTVSTNAFITSSRNINMYNGGSLTIASGGSLTRTSGAGEIIFNNGNTYSLVVNDASTGIEWDKIVSLDSLTLNISGNGRISLTSSSSGGNILAVRGEHATINNNLTGTFNCNGIVYGAAAHDNVVNQNQTVALAQDVVYLGRDNTFNNAGTITMGDDLLYQQASNTFSNTGTCTVTDIVNFLTDSNTLVNSGTMNVNGVGFADGLHFEATRCAVFNSGTMSVANQLVTMNNADDDNYFVNQSGGVFNLAGDFQLNDADFSFRNSGTVNMSARFDDFAGTDSIVNLSGGIWNYAGIQNTAANTEVEIYADNNANHFNYTRSDASKQQIIVPQDAYWHLGMSGSGTKEAMGTLDINGDVNISGTANFDVNTNNCNITIAGNWNRTSGTFDEGTERVMFDGTSAQSITASGGETYYDLVNFNTNGDISLNHDVHVDNNLTLTLGSNGKFILNASDLTIDQNATITGGGSNEFMVTNGTGYLRQEDIGSGGRTGSILFPVGTSTTNYTPCTIQNLGTSDRFDVKVRPQVLFSGTSGPAQLTDVVDVTWDIEEAVVGGSNATLALQWNLSDELAGFDRSNCYIMHYGTSWVFQQPLGPSTGANPYTRTVTGIANFSPFAIEDISNPLPVTLAEFNARYENGTVLTWWKTLTEVNNDYFTVQRSVDAINFEDIGVVKGAGNSNVIRHYQFEDKAPYQGRSYYRLKQTDFNGKHAYSYIVPVELNGIEILNIFPNPSDDKIQLLIGSSRLDDLVIQICTVEGKIVKKLKHRVHDGVSQVAVWVQELQSGYYIVSATTGDGRHIAQKHFIKN